MVANLASEEPGLRACWLTCGPEDESIGQLAEGGALGTAMGAWLCGETGVSTGMGVGEQPGSRGEEPGEGAVRSREGEGRGSRTCVSGS